MSSQLREAYSLPNLRRAWRWIKTNSDPLFKNYFRELYRAYAVAESENLAYLHSKLRRHFSPSDATKFYFPKKSGVLRPYTLLTIEDQIVYQALINIIAEKLLPRRKRNYLKTNFGHLYAGKRSQYFYVNWKRSYKYFGKGIRNAYEKGYVYGASFDLTACYDSIDHSVLTFFLKSLRVDNDLIAVLLSCLQKWTKPFFADPIYQGHGIPQGPLSSGLLSEVVLSYFDKTAGNPKIKYFRYVDDIRIYAKNERNLRRALVQIDVYSKKIGLFPQSSKINIHKVKDIAEEIKNISNPPETTVHPIKGNQGRAKKRLKELSFRYKIESETRFKYVLGGVLPNMETSVRLIKLLKLYPHLYSSIFRYYRQYEKLPYGIAKDLLAILKDDDLYYSFSAELIRTAKDRIPKKLIPYYVDQVKKITRLHNSTGVLDLKTAALSFLLRYNEFTFKEIEALLKNKFPSWTKVQLLDSINCDYLGAPSSETILNYTLESSEDDVGLYSAFLIGVNGYRLKILPRKANNFSLITLNKFGITWARYSMPCGIEFSLKEMLGKNPIGRSWKALFGADYKEVTKRFILAKAYFQTDPNSWVLMMDTIHDVLLNRLFRHDGGIASYQLGNIGGALNGTSRFALKYPKLFDVVTRIHSARLEARLSHYVVKKTGKKTRNIRHSELHKAKRYLLEGYEELGRLW